MADGTRGTADGTMVAVMVTANGRAITTVTDSGRASSRCQCRIAAGTAENHWLNKLLPEARGVLEELVFGGCIEAAQHLVAVGETAKLGNDVAVLDGKLHIAVQC
jgi:hypothetical protein